MNARFLFLAAAAATATACGASAAPAGSLRLNSNTLVQERGSEDAGLGALDVEQRSDGRFAFQDELDARGVTPERALGFSVDVEVSGGAPARDACLRLIFTREDEQDAKRLTRIIKQMDLVRGEQTLFLRFAEHPDLRELFLAEVKSDEPGDYRFFGCYALTEGSNRVGRRTSVGNLSLVLTAPEPE